MKLKILIPISGKSNRIILEEKKESTEGELLLPDSQKQETFIGVVKESSNWTNDNGIEFEPILKKGDVVLFHRMGAYRFNFFGENLVTMRESEVIGIIKENQD